MASGNHVCSGNWPDLPIHATKSAKAPAVMATLLGLPLRAQADRPRMLKPDTPRCSWVQEFALKKRMLVPTSRPMSPVRVVKNALRAARLFALSSHQ